MLAIKLTVTYIVGHLSPILQYATPPVLNSEMNSHTSPFPNVEIRAGPLEQSIYWPRSQSAQIQLFLEP